MQQVMADIHKKKWRPKPTQILVLGFLVFIFIGTILLALPFSSSAHVETSVVNALFTSVSAACVTGQEVVTTAEYWSPFGIIVITCMMQIGGLGVITLTTMAVMLVQGSIDLRSRLSISTAFGQEYTGGMAKLVRRVWKITLLFEGTGAFILTAAFYFSGVRHLTLLQAAGWGIFHSISAFCNAGYDVVGAYSLVSYAGSPAVCIPIMLLVICGGLGFPVWIELGGSFFNKRTLRAKIRRLSVHTKMVLAVTAVLLVGGALLFLLFEWNNPATMGPMPWREKILAAFFQSSSLRTAGFVTLPQGRMREASQFFACVLMLVGGSPSGTASGMKTTTVGVLFFTMLSALRGKNEMEAFKRRLPLEALQKAICVLMLLLFTWFGTTLALCFTELGSLFRPGFIDLLFEGAAVSATVGASTGLTPHLSVAGRVVCSAAMFMGRLGPVTVVMALGERRGKKKTTANVHLPEANIIVG